MKKLRRSWFRWWFWNKWNNIYWDWRNGLRNYWYYRKVVWDLSDADHSSILALMEHSSRDIANHLNKHNITTDARKRARELTIVACLCKRLREEDYFTTCYTNAYFNNTSKTSKFDHYKYMYQQDLDYLRFMLRRLPFWWC